jgi:hypothetical protein
LDGTVTIEVELADKIRALDRLGKSIGLFKEKSESTVAHTVEFVDPKARIMERLAQLKAALDAERVAEIDPPIRRPALPQPAEQQDVIDIE